MWQKYEEPMLTDMGQKSEQKEFKYGKSTIDYQLIVEKRKNLAITVRPDKSVLVKAPIESKRGAIEDKLQKRGKWILKQINYFDKFHPLLPEREYVSGETHYYIGRQYRLRLRKGKEESVKLIGKFFVVKTNEPENYEHVKILVNNWYADHAKLLLDRRIRVYAERVLGSGFGDIEIQYKFLKRRWGSYDPSRAITFNVELIKTPIQCIDYVIVHELCHLVYPNHDKAFYQLLRRIIPDWQTRKEKLELFGIR